MSSTTFARNLACLKGPRGGKAGKDTKEIRSVPNSGGESGQPPEEQWGVKRLDENNCLELRYRRSPGFMPVTERKVEFGGAMRDLYSRPRNWCRV